MNKNLYKVILAAVLTALICVGTMVIQIPMPLTNGYVNLGDCFIILAAWALGGPWSVAAAGIGSAMADLLTGYAHYAPGTLIIKALMAFIYLLLYKAVSGKKDRAVIGTIVGGIGAELVMIVGYFFYAWLLLGKSFEGASGSIPGNLIQGVFGIVCGVLMVTALDKLGFKKRFKLSKKTV